MKYLPVALVLLFAGSLEAQSPDTHSYSPVADAPRRAPMPARTTFLPLSVDPGTLVDGDRVLFRVSERGSFDQDLNGDGDEDDTVVHLYDFATGTTTNLELAIRSPAVLTGDWALFLVSESSQGATDLNGDGGVNDRVLHAYDLTTASVYSSGLAGSYRPAADGEWIVFAVDENDQGMTDLNGDGDHDDEVIHFWNPREGGPISSGLACLSIATLHAPFALLQVWESSEGDLNGDGDQGDIVLHSLDMTSQTLVNTALAVKHVVAGGPYSAFLVGEPGQRMDLNGDGDELDEVVHVYDSTSGTLTNLGLSVNPNFIGGGHQGSWTSEELSLVGSKLSFVTFELDEGRDLDGNGSMLDFVLHCYDYTSGDLTALGGNTLAYYLGERILAFDLAEDAPGTGDLNGDGDTLDRVVHVLDLETGQVTNLQRDLYFRPVLPPTGVDAYSTSGPVLAFLVSEYGDGQQDLNGDGDFGDAIGATFHVDTGQLFVSNRAGPSFQDVGEVSAGERQVFFAVSEVREGRDLNLDGDTGDEVLVAMDPRTGVRELVREAVLWRDSDIAQGRDLTVVTVSELRAGGQDLNGDGDAVDFVPTIVRVR